MSWFRCYLLCLKKVVVLTGIFCYFLYIFFKKEVVILLLIYSKYISEVMAESIHISCHMYSSLHLPTWHKLSLHKKRWLFFVGFLQMIYCFPCQSLSWNETYIWVSDSVVSKLPLDTYKMVRKLSVCHNLILQISKWFIHWWLTLFGLFQSKTYSRL